MALIKTGTVGTSAPLLAYELHAEQIGASGTKRTVKVTAKFKVNGSSNWWYGYACNWRARVHGSYGSWTSIKGTESWNGGQAYRTFSQTLTVDVGTTSSTSIVVGLYTDSQIDNGWDGSATGSFTVGSTNVAPTISGTVETSPSGTIAENTASITVTAPLATDANGNLSGYRCRVSVNDGGYTEIYRGASRSFSHNVSGYGEGTTFKYCFDCYDSAGAWSGNVYSAVVTKNRFTADTLNSSSSIAYSTASISFTYSGASNTNGNTSFTKVLSCDGVTVYNSTVTGSSATVTIYKSGTTPITPYIKFNDIKNKFASASYKGTLTFTLKTTNAYGTAKISSKSISVNLQTNPNAVGSCNIATNTNSTAYKTVSSTGNKYFIPDGSNHIRVDWTAGSGNLGEAITYELYVAYGSGSWSKIATLASGTLYYNHVVPKQSSSQSIKYKIRTKTDYGTYADRDTSVQTLHYYNPPSLTQGTLTRGANTCDAQVTIKSLSSIPNINTVGTWNCYNKGTTTSVSNGSLTVSQAVQTIKVTNLTDAGQYDLKVTFKDDTGFSSNVTVSVAIGANSPLFFVNKYGAGVNGIKADATYSLKVKGSIGITDSEGHHTSGIRTYAQNGHGYGMTIQSGGGMIIGSGESPTSLMNTLTNTGTETMYVTSDGEIQFVANANTFDNRITNKMETNGNLRLAKNLVFTGDNNEHQLIFEDSGSDSRKVYFYNGNSSSSTVLGIYDHTKAWTVCNYGVDNKLYTQRPLVVSGGLQYDGKEILNGSDTWLRTYGDNGWYNTTHGGGWHMTDSTWIRSYNNKNVYINKILRADGGIQVGENVNVVSSGESGSNRWVRFYDGTQICWGEYRYKTSTHDMTSNTTTGVYGGISVSISFPVTFATIPGVSVVSPTNGYTNSQATSITTSAFIARAWNNYPTSVSFLYFSWMAIGRWK